MNEILAKIQELIKKAPALNQETREEILQLTDKLEQELETLSKTNAEEAGSIANYAHMSVHEALRKDQDNTLKEHSLSGLKVAIRNFEATHPELSGIVSTITNLLADLGI